MTEPRAQTSVSRLEWQQRHTQALRDTAESLQVARATAHTLSVQSEQIGRSERMLDETQAAVDVSKRVLRGLTWSGWLYNKISTVPPRSNNNGLVEIAMGFICPECKVTFESSEHLWMHYSSVHERKSGEERPMHSARQRSKEQVQQVHEQSQDTDDLVRDMHDRFLRDLEPQIMELKEQSLALGSALDAQNEQLDRMDSKIGRVHHDLKKVGIQANRIAGKKTPVVFRFRCALQETQSGKFLRDVDGEALLGADVVVDGCAFRAYMLGDDSDVWGFQSEKSSHFLGINRYGYLKVRGADMNSYEQFLVECKSTTPLFSLSSYFGLGGWIAVKGSADSKTLTIIRGTPENKQAAALFKIVRMEENMKKVRQK
ncbi:unnamed protein product [Hyaloperonospora brassicae]|uniref:C2H2-type domain-containing protein n=1 Tax=Hyaloperonospora brassicae TaxID=162125 RepID=A0AAV0V0R7_HYABA|nr:unnamed protein product [Hyaloperonospora brassicae]